MEQFFLHRLEGENTSIWNVFFFLFPAPSHDKGRTFNRKRPQLFSSNTDAGEETEKIQKGVTWKDLKVVICSSNFHLEISSLSPHIRMCHHALVLVYKIQINHTSNSTQQKCIQTTTLKAFLSCSKQVSLMGAITCNFWSPLTGHYTSPDSLKNWINTAMLYTFSVLWKIEIFTLF